MDSNFPEFFSAWSDELAVRSNQVRRLIGDRHWHSDGSHKEFLITDFLLRYLPSTLLVSRGFIKSLRTDQVSREVDILISNPASHVPLFNEGGLLITPPSSVLATIEVKSTYRPDVLKAAFTNCQSIMEIMAANSPDTRYSSVIFFVAKDDASTAMTIHNNIASQIKRLNEDTVGVELPHQVHQPRFPSVVVVLGEVVTIPIIQRNNEINIRTFETGKYSGAVAFAILFEHLRKALTNTSTNGDLSDLWEGVSGIPCHSHIWKPGNGN